MNEQLEPDEQMTWRKRIEAAHEKPIHRKNVVDDGLFSHMAAEADFERGCFEMPIVHGISKRTELPSRMIPFSMLGRSTDSDEIVCFFEKDPMFADAIVAADDYLEDLKKFPFVLTPDCSLYRDMPIAAQIANVYLSRLVGSYFEQNGMRVIPTIRWSTEVSYTTEIFPEPFAFAGAPKRSTVAIGTYGCIQKADDKLYFREGLAAMLDYLKPRRVLVYGAMPETVFAGFRGRTEFIRYSDWTSAQHGK